MKKMSLSLNGVCEGNINIMVRKRLLAPALSQMGFEEFYSHFRVHQTSANLSPLKLRIDYLNNPRLHCKCYMLF